MPKDGDEREQEISLNAVLYPLEYACISGRAGGSSMVAAVAAVGCSSATDENKYEEGQRGVVIDL